MSDLYFQIKEKDKILNTKTTGSDLVGNVSDTRNSVAADETGLAGNFFNCVNKENVDSDCAIALNDTGEVIVSIGGEQTPGDGGFGKEGGGIDACEVENSHMPDLKQHGFKTFSKYVSLNVIGLLAFNCYILADTFFVAKGIGIDALAGLNLALPVFGFIHGFGMMFGMGGATRLAVMRAKDDTGHKPLFHSLLLAAFMGIIFVLIGVFASEKLSVAMGAKGNIVPLTVTYVSVALYFAPAFFINHVLMCYVRNDGNPALSMLALAVGSIGNVILDYVFIFPLGMGMFGAIIATGLAPIMSLCVLVFHFFTKKNTLKIKICKPDFKLFGNIISLGVFSFLSEVSNGISILLFNTVILSLTGNVGVAAYGIVANVFLVAIGFFNGVSQGMQPLVSRCYGAGELEQARKLYLFGVATVFVLGTVMYAVLAGFAGSIVSLFNGENDVQLTSIATYGILLYFIALFFAGFNIVTAGYFGAIEKAGRAFIIAFSRGLVILIPMLFLFSHFMEMTGVWLSFTFAEIIVAVSSIAFIAAYFTKLLKSGNISRLKIKNRIAIK